MCIVVEAAGRQSPKWPSQNLCHHKCQPASQRQVGVLKQGAAQLQVRKQDGNAVLAQDAAADQTQQCGPCNESLLGANWGRVHHKHINAVMPDLSCQACAKG